MLKKESEVEKKGLWEDKEQLRRKEVTKRQETAVEALYI